MISIVIVDDENIIRRGIKSTLDKYGADRYRVVGMAADGDEGLELAEALRPDIVISDIRMNRVGGIEMAREMRRRGIPARVLFLSGFDEFAYIKSAIDLRAENYLLKPVNPRDLLAELDKIAADIHQEASLRRQIDENIPAMQQSFLHKLLNDPEATADERLCGDIEFLGLDFAGDRFAVLLFKLDGLNTPRRFEGEMERELHRYAVINLVREHLEQNYRAAIYHLEDGSFALVVSSARGAAMTNRRLIEVARQLCALVKERLGATVTIAVGGVEKGFPGITRSYFMARNLRSYRYLLGKDRVITIADVRALATPDAPGLELGMLIQQTISHIKLGEAGKAQKALDDIEQLVRKSEGVTLSRARVVVVELLVLISKELRPLGDERAEDIMEKIYALSERVLEIETVEDLFGGLKTLVGQVVQTAFAERGGQQQSLIGKAMAYVEANCASNTLSLQQVAEHVHISPSYLSALFRKIAKVSFSDYLADQRIQKARALLRGSPLKVYEVAELVGYSNPQYFNQAFKKRTGQSPHQYRKTASEE